MRLRLNLVRIQLCHSDFPSIALAVLFTCSAPRDGLPEPLHRLSHPTLPNMADADVEMVDAGPSKASGSKFAKAGGEEADGKKRFEVKKVSHLAGSTHASNTVTKRQELQSLMFSLDS